MHNLNTIKYENLIIKIKRFTAIFVALYLVISFLFAAFPAAGIKYNETDNTYTFITKNEGGAEISAYDPIDVTKCKSSFAPLALKLVYYCYGGLADSLSSSSLFSVPDPTEENGVWGLFWSLYDVTRVIGVTLMLVWIIIDLIDKIAEGRINTEYIIRMALKFTFGTFIMVVGKELCISLIGLGNNITSSMSSAVQNWMGTTAVGGRPEGVGDPMFDAHSIMEQITKGHLFTCLGFVFEYIIPGLAILGAMGVALATLIGRVFELGLRTAFMPIGMADIISHGTVTSPGMRYIKRFCACACQGAAMYIILMVGTSLMTSSGVFNLFGGSAFLSTFGLLPLQVIVGFTMVGAMKKTDNILHEVFA